MQTYNRKPVTFVKGNGVYLWDNDGKRYIDALCGLAVTSLGHSNKLISDVISDQSKTLIHTSNAFQIESQQQLASRLCKLSGMSNAFFCNSGAESVETAIKIARKYGNNKNLSSPKIIVMENSFHGRTLAALSATSNQKSHQGFTPLVEGFIRVPFDSTKEILELLKKHKDIIAVMVEPIQGEGGIQIPKAGYIKKLREICDDNELLLMIDEVQSGFCRTGKWFGYQHDQILPDVIMLAKALGNGVPIGACLASGKASNLLQPGSHGSTFGGNYLSTSVGLKVLDIMRDMNLCRNAREMGIYFLEKLNEIIASKPVIKDIRCKGMMIGIELDRECADIVIKALDHGLVLNVTKNNIIRMLPPLIIKKAEIDDIVNILDKVIV